MNESAKRGPYAGETRSDYLCPPTIAGIASLVGDVRPEADREVVAYADGQPIYADPEEDAERLADREERRWRHPSEFGQGFVYFIQAEDGGPIKIGWALNPQYRLLRLQTGHPERLVVRKQVHGSRVLEGRFHKRFAEAHLRGEWFASTIELERFLEEPAPPVPRPREPEKSLELVEYPKLTAGPRPRTEEEEREYRYALILQEQRDYWQDRKRRGLRSTPRAA